MLYHRYKDTLINSEEELPKFIRLLNYSPELPRLPLMIDSSHWKTLLAGMKIYRENA